MYSKLDIISAAEEQAEIFAMSDRMVYKKYIEIAEYYAHKNDLIIGGDSANHLLLNSGNPDLDSIRYIFYCDNPRHHAVNLCNQLFDDDLGRYVRVMTKVSGHMFSIEVDTRELFIIYGLSTARGIKSSKLINTFTVLAQFAKDEKNIPLKMLCLGPELQLLQIYAHLSDPSKSSEWTNLMVTEQSLRALIFNDITPSTRRFITDNASDKSGLIRFVMWKNIICDPSTDRVVTGNLADAFLINLDVKKKYTDDDITSLVKKVERLQYITSKDLVEEQEAIESVAKKYNISVEFTLNDPKIPTEVRLKRLTVYLVRGKNKESFMDVFNIGCYEIVPYIPFSILSNNSSIKAKIGTYFVCMRIKLVDIWVAKILEERGAIKKDMYMMLVQKISTNFNEMATQYEALIKLCATECDNYASYIFPFKTYCCLQLNLNTEYRRKAVDTAIYKLLPYYPFEKK